MKKRITILLIIVLGVVLALQAPTLEPQLVNVKANSNIPHSNYEYIITVTGQGELIVVPDTAIIEVGVESEGAELSAVNSENAQKMEKLIELLKEQNILENQIRTKHFNFYKRFDYSNGQQFLGYTVNNVIAFSTEDFDGLTGLIVSLTDNGANVLNSVRFSLKDSKQHYYDALKLAVDDAKQKLSRLTPNSQDFEVVEVRENSVNFNMPQYDHRMFVAKAESNSLLAGENTVSAGVIVKFAIKSGQSTELLNKNTDLNISNDKEVIKGNVDIDATSEEVMNDNISNENNMQIENVNNEQIENVSNDQIKSTNSQHVENVNGQNNGLSAQNSDFITNGNSNINANSSINRNSDIDSNSVNTNRFDSVIPESTVPGNTMSNHTNTEGSDVVNEQEIVQNSQTSVSSRQLNQDTTKINVADDNKVKTMNNNNDLIKTNQDSRLNESNVSNNNSETLNSQLTGQNNDTNQLQIIQQEQLVDGNNAINESVVENEVASNELVYQNV